jgi:hypothetical protein
MDEITWETLELYDDSVLEITTYCSMWTMLQVNSYVIPPPTVLILFYISCSYYRCIILNILTCTVQENKHVSNNCKYIHLIRKILHWAPKAYEHNTTRSKINSLCMNDYQNKLHGLSPQARTIPTERLTLVSEVSANFSGYRVLRGQRNESPTVVNFGFLDRSCYLLEISPQLSSRGWVDSIPDPLLHIKSGSARNQTRTSGTVARNSDN